MRRHAIGCATPARRFPAAWTSTSRPSTPPRPSDHEKEGSFVMSKTRAFGQGTAVPLSPALRCGDIVYVSGQVPTDAGGAVPEGIEAQTRAVLDKIRDLVTEAIERAHVCTPVTNAQLVCR